MASQEAEEAIAAVDRTGASDATAAVVAAMVSVIPGIGGPLSASVNEWRLHVATGRLLRVLRALKAAMDNVEGEVDRHFAGSAEFRKALDWSLEAATQARNADKVDFYAAALARTATFARPDESERELMLDTLDRLRPAHLAMLAAVATDREPPTDSRAYLNKESAAYERLRDALPSTSDDVLDRLWEDLAALRLLDSASLLTADGGQVAAHLPDSPLLPFGRRFLAFISPEHTRS